MTALAGSILMTKIVPLIVGAIRRGIARPMGCEDHEELAQDCVASAAAMVGQPG
jgi:hypothetical protein